jgi:hypothetical protein
MPLTAPQIGSKTAAETRNVSVSFLSRLDSGELLTGTPTIAVSPSGLTLGEPAVNQTSQYVNGRLHAAGTVVKFQVSGGSAGTVYTVSVYCDTTGDQFIGGAAMIQVT